MSLSLSLLLLLLLLLYEPVNGFLEGKQRLFGMYLGSHNIDDVFTPHRSPREEYLSQSRNYVDRVPNIANMRSTYITP